MPRILTRPLFRKGGLSKTPRPSYRGGGVTAIRPGYRGGGMNGIMSGIVPRRGYAETGFVASTPEEFSQQRKIAGLPYLTLPKIEEMYQKKLKDAESTVDMTLGIEELGQGTYAEKQQDLYDFLQTEKGKEYFKKPFIEKMKKQVAERKSLGLDVSKDAIVAETNGTKTNGTGTGDGTGLDTRSQFEKYFGEYLPVIQEQLAPDSDAAARDKWLALAEWGRGFAAEPGGDLVGAAAKAAEKPLETLGKISAQERQAKQVPKMIAIQAALNRMKGPTSQDRAIDASRIDNIAKDITGRSKLTYETAYKVAEQLDDLRKSDSKLAGKFNEEMPSEPKEIAKIKGPKYFYTDEGDLKVVKDGVIYSLKEWQSQKEA